MTTSRTSRWRRSVALAAVTATLLVGCTDGTGDADEGADATDATVEGTDADATGDEVAIRLIVGDNHVREEGVECAGARPFGYVRVGAPFTIEDADGTVLVEGELPAGESFNADPSIDWGVRRIPTICVLEFDVPELPERDTYLFRLPEGSPLEFEPDDITDDEPVLLLLG